MGMRINTFQPSAVEGELDDRIEDLTKKIVQKIKAGDKRAFSDLVALYHGRVADVAFKVVGDRDEAADIAQNVFVKISRNIWRYDENRSFHTWLYRITVNAAIDYLRKNGKHDHDSIEFADTSRANSASPEASFQLQRLRHYIAEATNTLNEKQRLVFLYRYVDGCNISDVADMMNMPKATVRWYLHRARSKVKKHLLDKCPHLILTIGIK
jgi:RNA polymerase sigma-70 factor (ECF subfamily)